MTTMQSQITSVEANSYSTTFNFRIDLATARLHKIERDVRLVVPDKSGYLDLSSEYADPSDREPSRRELIDDQIENGRWEEITDDELRWGQFLFVNAEEAAAAFRNPTETLHRAMDYMAFVAADKTDWSSWSRRQIHDYAVSRRARFGFSENPNVHYGFYEAA